MSDTPTIHEAFVTALGALANPVKDAHADTGKFGYSFVTLPKVLDTIRPVLAAHGLAVTQDQVMHDGNLIVTTTVRHTSGESITFGPMVARASADMQQLGSSATYMRRYQLLGALGLAGDEDDDGQAVAGKPVHREEPSAVSSEGVRTTLRGPAAAHDAKTPASPKAVGFAKTLATEAGLDPDTLPAYYAEFVSSGHPWPGWDHLSKPAVSALIDSLKEEVAKQSAKVERVSYVPQAGRDYTPPGNEGLRHGPDEDDPWLAPIDPETGEAAL